MPVTPQETAATLRQRSADARRAAESRAADVRDRVVALVRAQLPAGGRAWLIGSLACGGFGVRSDVDGDIDRGRCLHSPWHRSGPTELRVIAAVVP